MGKANKVLVTSEDIHPILDERLSELGYSVESIRDISNNQLKEIIHSYVGVVISSKTIMDRSMIDKGSVLKFIARAGSGMEIVDVEYAESKGIHCLSSPEGNCDAVAEHAMAMLLALLNRLIPVSVEIEKKIWRREENRGEALEGKIVGIIGFGNTGSAFAQRLQGFNTRTIVYDKYLKEISSKGVEQVDMPVIFEESDIVSLHIPLTEETQYMVDNNWLNKFKKQIYLVNTSRGKIVRTTHLLTNIEGGKIKGACLDVLENEKPQSWTAEEEEIYSRLMGFENVLITPHIAGWSHLSKLRLATVLADKIASLETTVNPLS